LTPPIFTLLMIMRFTRDDLDAPPPPAPPAASPR